MPLHLAIALVFLAANAGFTMVVHSCMMEEMTCCAPMEAGGTMQKAASAHGDPSTVAGIPPSCCSNTVVGGSTSTAATLENLLPSAQPKFTVTAPAGFESPDADLPAKSALRAFARQRFRPPDPSPCGLHIANASLLI